MRRSISFLLLFVFMVSCRSGKDTSPELPNILIILTDDMGYGDYGFAGNPYLETPHFDSLASRGFRFEKFYVSPVCAPTRASLLTGKYHQRCGVRSVTNGYEMMDPDEYTLAELLRDKGYVSGIFGKWHLGEYYPSLPNAQGFDEYFGFRTGHIDDYFDPVLEHNGELKESKGYITDILTDSAMQFMQKNRGQPSFCYLAYNAPHTPLLIADEWVEKYLEMDLDEKTAKVYGMVENIDMNIGRIMSMLHQSNLLKNTIIIYLSDNGPISKWQAKQNEIRYNGGLRDQKFSIYEGGIRTQCIWYWQGKWERTYDTSSLAAHIDIVPTLLDAINEAHDEEMNFDGVSLREILDNNGKKMEDRLYFEKYALSTLRDPAPFPGGIARKGKWKMVNGTELYDLHNDEGETRNLAAEFPRIMDEMVRDYQGFYQDVNQHHDFQPRPVKIGYAAENPVSIQPHHGIRSGNIQFTNPNGNTHPTGVDGSFLTNWKEKGDGVTWRLESVRDAIYKIGIKARGSFRNCSFVLQVGNERSTVSVMDSSLAVGWAYIPLIEIQMKRDSVTEMTLLLDEKKADSNFAIKELMLRYE